MSESDAGSRSRRLGHLARTLGLGALLGAALGWKLMRGRKTPAAPSAGDFLSNLAKDGFTPAILLAIVPWLALSIYWEIVARSAAATKSSESRWSRLFHLTLVTIGQLLLIIPLPGLLRARFLPRSPILAGVGIAIEVAAVAFSIWARRTLGRNWSGAVTTKVDHELVRTGPYRWVRHPIYTGMFGLCLGTALVAGEARALAGIAIIVVAFWRKIRQEETLLDGLFGAKYTDYRGHTWAVVPGIW